MVELNMILFQYLELLRDRGYDARQSENVDRIFIRKDNCNIEVSLEVIDEKLKVEFFTDNEEEFLVSEVSELLMLLINYHLS